MLRLRMIEIEDLLRVLSIEAWPGANPELHRGPLQKADGHGLTSDGFCALNVPENKVYSNAGHDFYILLPSSTLGHVPLVALSCHACTSVWRLRNWTYQEPDSRPNGTEPASCMSCMLWADALSLLTPQRK